MNQPPPTINGIPLRAHYAGLAMQALIPGTAGMKLGEICDQAVGFADVLIYKLGQDPTNRITELEAALQGSLTWIKETAEDGDGGHYDVEKDEKYIGWKATLEKGKQ